MNTHTHTHVPPTNPQTNPTNPTQGRIGPVLRDRLRDAHARLGYAKGLRATLDRWHAKLAAENPAVSATEVGEAWGECWGRAGVCLDVCRRELDQLLDGDVEGADRSRRTYYIAGNAIESRVETFCDAVDRR